jgi:short/branched chain acyl-CoA dehydrogenase
VNFELTEEQLMIKKMVREFSEKEIQPIANELNEQGIFPCEIYRQLGELGLMGVPYPEEYGGGGGDWLTFAIVHEEISRADPSVANTLVANSSVSSLIHYFGTKEQKEKWLPQILTGKKVGAIALTEPNAGSDANNLRTTAKRDGQEWVINGNKTFITNGGTDMTGPVVVAAVTGTQEDGRKIISTFIVPKETEGLIISPPLKKIGFHASDTRELTFENCRIPADHLLGDELKGYRQALETISAGRFLIAALALGLAQGCYEKTMKYVHEREVFGKKLMEYQDIQFKLAEMATKIEVARLMVYKAACLKDGNKSFAKEASMAKMFTTKIAMEVSHEAVQMHGGYGVMREYDVSRFFGDAKILEIVEGSNEIQKIIISRILLKEAAKSL